MLLSWQHKFKTGKWHVGCSTDSMRCTCRWKEGRRKPVLPQSSPSGFSACSTGWCWPGSGRCPAVIPVLVPCVWLAGIWKNNELEGREGTVCFVSQAQTFSICIADAVATSKRSQPSFIRNVKFLLNHNFWKTERKEKNQSVIDPYLCVWITMIIILQVSSRQKYGTTPK